MKFVQKYRYKLFLLTNVVLVPVISFAQNSIPPAACGPGTGKICNPIAPINTIDEFIRIFLEGILRIGIPIVALAVIYSGFLFVSARGNAEKLTKAKDALFYTIIGAAILLGSWAIAKLISETVLAL